jgi:methylated-DNA-[protein]-cysteine S-methyltransferase
MPTLTVASPLGPLTVTERDGAIAALTWGEAGADDATTLLTRAATQLDAYFYCELKQFDLPFAPAGSPFQKTVWDAMLRIPYGQTRTYGDVARALDDASPQAVGTACGANPIPILIPCHRIVAAGDKLGGYSGKGGVDTKRFLLELEGWLGVAQRDLFGLAADLPAREPDAPADG